MGGCLAACGGFLGRVLAVRWSLLCGALRGALLGCGPCVPVVSMFSPFPDQFDSRLASAAASNVSRNAVADGNLGGAGGVPLMTKTEQATAKFLTPSANKNKDGAAVVGIKVACDFDGPFNYPLPSGPEGQYEAYTRCIARL